MSTDQREALRILVFSASQRAESLNTVLARLAVTAELGPISNASGLFGRPPLGKG